jgi:hypothetical protein
LGGQTIAYSRNAAGLIPAPKFRKAQAVLTRFILWVAKNPL